MRAHGPSRRREIGATAALLAMTFICFAFSVHRWFARPEIGLLAKSVEAVTARVSPARTSAASPTAMNPADARRRWPLDATSPRLATDAIFSLAPPGSDAVARRRSSAAPAVRSTVWVRADDGMNSTESTERMTLLFGELLLRIGASGQTNSSLSERPAVVVEDSAVNGSFVDAVFVLPSEDAPDYPLLREAIRSVRRHGHGLIRQILLISTSAVAAADVTLLSLGATVDRLITASDLDSSHPSASASEAFSEAWVESRIHRLRGLSRFFLFFRPNMLLGRRLSFFDLFRPVLASQAQGAVSLDAISLQHHYPALRGHVWAHSNGPISRTIDGATYFEFEPIVYADKKHRFADCSVHNEDHGRAPASAHCFYKYRPSTKAAPPERDAALWRRLADRVLRSVCYTEPPRGTEGTRWLTNGDSYEIDKEAEPDPCHFVTPTAYYDAYVAHRSQSSLDSEHIGMSAEERRVRATAWLHFNVFPWHKDAAVPRLVDRAIVAVAADSDDVYGIRSSLHSARLISDHGQHLALAERRAALAARTGATLGLCTKMQDMGRRLLAFTGSDAEWHGDRGDQRFLCIDSENDFAAGVDPSHVPRKALRWEEANRDSNLLFAKLFRAVVPVGSHSRFFQTVATNANQSVADVRAALNKAGSLFVTVTN